MREPYTGADQLIASALASGVNLCLANPGTTEMGLVASLDGAGARDMRTCLVLFEGVATGAADGYARLSGKPALSLLHLGPGLAYGLANQHNARRAHSPSVTLIGDHTTDHLPHDSPLTSDIDALAGPMSKWVGRSGSADTMMTAVGDAVQAARSPKTGPVTLIVPAEHQTDPARRLSGSERQALADWAPAAKPVPDHARIEHLAARLRRPGARPLFYVGGEALEGPCRDVVARLVQSTSGSALTSMSMAKIDRGGKLPEFARLPYFPETARAALSGANPLIVIGCRPPVAFFGGDGVESDLAAGLEAIVLAREDEDCLQALQSLEELLPKTDGNLTGAPKRLEVDFGASALDGRAIGNVVGHVLPEGAIVSVEGSTAGHSFFEASLGGAPHSVMTNTGGAIGQGLPVAFGASLAAPDRQVIALQSDGSAQYTLQTLWSMVREQTPVIVVIVANRRYAILDTELDRLDHAPGAVSAQLTTLTNPTLDWVSLASGYGMPAERVDNPRDLRRALLRGMATNGPALIEAII